MSVSYYGHCVVVKWILVYYYNGSDIVLTIEKDRHFTGSPMHHSIWEVDMITITHSIERWDSHATIQSSDNISTYHVDRAKGAAFVAVDCFRPILILGLEEAAFCARSKRLKPFSSITATPRSDASFAFFSLSCLWDRVSLAWNPLKSGPRYMYMYICLK